MPSSPDSMAASGPRERRPAVWPWLLMPAVVLLVFYALFRMHQQPKPPPAAPPAQTSDGN